MLDCYYIVESIDGDYAHLRKIPDEPGSETKLVARALLPETINEGTYLHYAMLQYEEVSREDI